MWKISPIFQRCLENSFQNPLLTLWLACSLPRLKNFSYLCYSSTRKVLKYGTYLELCVKLILCLTRILLWKRCVCISFSHLDYVLTMASLWLKISWLQWILSFLCLNYFFLCLNYFRSIAEQNVPEFSCWLVAVISNGTSDCKLPQVEPLCEGITLITQWN